MHPSPPPLLARLRRNRGLWVLATAVLLIKLVSSSVCVADGSGARLASAASDAAPTTLLVGNAVSAVSDDANACLMGEGSSCHCACAHSVTLPANVPALADKVGVGHELFVIHSGFTPATTGALLRPPIA